MSLLIFGVGLFWFTNFQCGRTQNVGYNLGPLQQLTQFRRHHRRTMEGKLCAAAFVQDDQVYTDCTTARAPDGTTGIEWCYVEVQLIGQGGGTRDWGFCLPPVDYDRVRLKAREAFDMKAGEAEKMIARLDGSITHVDQVLRRQQVDLLEKTILQAGTCLKKAEEVSASVDKIREEVRVVRQTVAAERRHAFTKADNCALVAGYEEEAFPDGIRGMYYSNAIFAGPPCLTRTDSAIDFFFGGEGPADGLHSHEYSIRWEGYVKAPRSGEFTFIVETDSGVRLFFNEHPIIVYGMPAATKADAVGENSVSLTGVPPSAGRRKVASQPVELLGGDKYKIRAEFVHTSHFKYENPDVSYIKLLWKSPSTREEVIPRQYYFTFSTSPPLKISSLDPRHFEVSLLLDGEKAFADTDSFTIGDIPQQFKGLRLIRGAAEPDIDSFSFSVNVPAIAYVAFPTDKPFPLAVAEADEDQKSHYASPSTTKAVPDIFLSLYHHYGPAATSSQLQLRDIAISEKTGGALNFRVMEKGVPFLIFLEKIKSADTSCGGVEEILSLVGGPELADCEVSSQQADQFGCRAALSGKHIDEKNGIWRTATGNEVDDEQKEVFGILHTDNFDSHAYTLERPVITSYLKATISEMYVNGEDSGGSFEFWGTPCSIPENEEEEALPSVEVMEVKSAPYRSWRLQSCGTSILEVPTLFPLEEGKQFFLKCPQHCDSFPSSAELSFVYGSRTYAPESSLCAAAAHSGACSDAAACCALVTIGGSRKSFYSSSSLPFQPASSSPASSAIPSPLVAPSAAPPPHASTSHSSSASSRANAAALSPVASSSSSSSTASPPAAGFFERGQTKSFAHGFSPVSLTFSSSPSACSASLPTSTIAPHKKIKITFGSEALPFPPSEASNLSEWMRDEGEIKQLRKGSGGEMATFGWLRSAHPVSCPSSTFSNPLNQGGISFAAAAGEGACSSKKEGVNEEEEEPCRENFWSISVPENGLYQLTVHLGNPCEPATGKRTYLLQANGVPVVDAIMLEKAQFLVAVHEVEVTDKIILLSAVCDPTGSKEKICKDAITTIMNVTVPANVHVLWDCPTVAQSHQLVYGCKAPTEFVDTCGMRCTLQCFTV